MSGKSIIGENKGKKGIGGQIASFFKKETVLCLAAAVAGVSMFFVPPDRAYLEYPDFRVLALLFCLMLVVAGLQSVGLFRYLGFRLLGGMRSTRQLSLLLVALCFFSSMIITNDVALITFVPFAVMVLKLADQGELLIPVVVQTVAANLGSMLTPIGNPQNLYLYSAFDLSMGSFLGIMFPLALLSMVLLGAAVFLRGSKPLTVGDMGEVKAPPKGRLLAYIGLFLVCLGCEAFAMAGHAWSSDSGRAVHRPKAILGGGLFSAADVSVLFPIHRKCGADSCRVLSAAPVDSRLRAACRGCSQSGHQQCSRSDSAFGVYGECPPAFIRCEHRGTGHADRLSGQRDFLSLLWELRECPKRDLPESFYAV